MIASNIGFIDISEILIIGGGSRSLFRDEVNNFGAKNTVASVLRKRF